MAVNSNFHIPTWYSKMEREGLKELCEALPSPFSPLLHVEICQKPYSTLKASVVKDHVRTLLSMKSTVFEELVVTEFDDPVLHEHVMSVSVVDMPRGIKFLNFSSMRLLLHVFQLHEEGPAQEEVEDESDVSAANNWLLPNMEFNGLWESLVYDSEVKQNLLNYAETMLLFSDKGVDANVISWNRVVLLHGPPGTGKTSLCKALAQKLCIRLSERYSYGQLVEINSHSLFSKWFSESGKLVQKMFTMIQGLILDPEALVCVLIDEVESLTAARKAAISGSEPSDAIRVVNALLTQIDQIKRYPNVVILTTSNVTGAIDLAFVDRADIKQYIGMPSTAAVFQIYHSCIKELMRVGIITPPQQLLSLRALEVIRFVENDATKPSLKLRDVAHGSEGLSGRTLRKLPFLAQALYTQKHTVSLEDFLCALQRAAVKQFKETEELVNAS